MMRCPQLLLVTVLAFAIGCDDRELYLQLQREIGRVSLDVQTLEDSLEQRTEALTAAATQMREGAEGANRNLENLDASLREGLRAREGALGAVAQLDAKLTDVGGEIERMRAAVADLNSRLSRLQAQISELENTLRTKPPPPLGTSSRTSLP